MMSKNKKYNSIIFLEFFHISLFHKQLARFRTFVAQNFDFLTKIFNFNFDQFSQIIL